jgi:hypothetical protein
MCVSPLKLCTYERKKQCYLPHPVLIVDASDNTTRWGSEKATKRKQQRMHGTTKAQEFPALEASQGVNGFGTPRGPVFARFATCNTTQTFAAPPSKCLGVMFLPWPLLVPLSKNSSHPKKDQDHEEIDQAASAQTSPR